MKVSVSDLRPVVSQTLMKSAVSKTALLHPCRVLLLMKDRLWNMSRHDLPPMMPHRVHFQVKASPCILRLLLLKKLQWWMMNYPAPWVGLALIPWRRAAAAAFVNQRESVASRWRSLKAHNHRVFCGRLTLEAVRAPETPRLQLLSWWSCQAHAAAEVVQQDFALCACQALLGLMPALMHDSIFWWGRVARRS